TEDGGVALQELQAALTRSLVDACRDHDHTTTGEVGVIAAVHLHGVRERHGVLEVVGLGLRAGEVLVHQDDLPADALHDHGVAGGGADQAGSDDADFHGATPAA